MCCCAIETSNTETISNEFWRENVDSSATGMSGHFEIDPLHTYVNDMAIRSTTKENPHMYEILNEPQFRIRLLETLDAEQGMMESNGVRKKTKVPIIQKLCTGALISMVTCLVVWNVTVVLLFINDKSACTDAGRWFFLNRVAQNMYISLRKRVD